LKPNEFDDESKPFCQANPSDEYYPDESVELYERSTVMYLIGESVHSKESLHGSLDESKLSASYSDLKDKHCLLKLRYCNLKTDYRYLRIKRETACKQAAIYHRKYEEAAKYLSSTNPLKDEPAPLGNLLDLSSPPVYM